jgi:hypothetical protein
MSLNGCKTDTNNRIEKRAISRFAFHTPVPERQARVGHSLHSSLSLKIQQKICILPILGHDFAFKIRDREA